jgi:hypothetical protein
MAGSLDDATDFRLPFGMGKLDITNPVGATVMFVALVGGMTVWNMADSIGERFSQRGNQYLARLTGVDVDGGSGGVEVL